MAQISIGIAADTRDAAKSVDSLGATFQELADKVKQLGDPQLSAAVEKLQADMERAQEQTQKAAAGVSALDRSLQNGGTVTGLNAVRQGFKEAGDASEKLGEQVGEKGKLREGLEMNASFSLPMMATALGENGLAGAAEEAGSSIAGMGMMMGPEVAVPAAVLGGVVAWLASKLKDTEVNEQAVESAAGDLVKTWNNSAPAADKFAKALAAWAENSSDYGIKLQDLEKDSDQLGISFGKAAEAMTTQNLPALQKLKKATEDQKASAEDTIQAYQNQVKSQGAVNDVSAEQYAQALKTVKASGDVAKALDQQIKAAKTAAEVEQAEAKAQGLTVKQYEAKEKAANDLADAESDLTDTEKAMAKQAGINNASVGKFVDAMNEGQSVASGFGSELSGISDQQSEAAKAQEAYTAAVKKYGPASKEAKAAQQQFNEAAEGFDVQQYIDNMNAAETANTNFLTDVQQMVGQKLSEAGQQFVTQNQATAQKAWEAAKGNKAQQQALINAWNTAGAQSAESFGEQIGKGIYNAMANAQNAANKGVKLPVILDDAAAQAQLAELTKTRVATIITRSQTQAPAGVSRMGGP